MITIEFTGALKAQSTLQNQTSEKALVTLNCFCCILQHETFDEKLL